MKRPPWCFEKESPFLETGLARMVCRGLALPELSSPPRGQITAVVLLSSGLASLKHTERVASRGHPD